MSDKVWENRLRRMAERQGLRLVKSRRRDPYASDYGKYWLMAGDDMVSHSYGNLELIEERLTEGRPWNVRDTGESDA
jgi:hypothetical protein